MIVTIFGANGQIGRLLIPKLVKAGHTVRGVVRDETQRDTLATLGAEVVFGDLEGDFTHALQGADAAVFTAGSGAKTGADKTLLVDLWGAARTMRQAQTAGVSRYIMVSARNADNPDNAPAKLRHYVVAKHFADRELQASKLDFTILRPGRLLNDPETGRVRTERPDTPDAQAIARGDVAEAIATALADDRTIGLVTELYAGDVPVADALTNAASGSA